MSTDKVIFVGEQCEATRSHMTESDVTGSHVTRRDHVRNRKQVMRMRNRKFHNTPSRAFSPEVSSMIGSDRVRMSNRYILHYYQSSNTSTWLPKGWKGVRMPNRKLRNIPLVVPFHRKLATGSDVIFPRIFLSGSTKCWLDVLYDVRVYPFPLLSAPFIFIITFKVSCFRICCVVLQGWYF